MTLNKLEEALLFMFDYFDISSSKPLQIYIKALDKIDDLWIADRIRQLILTWQPKYKGHYPSIAEILNPLFNATESEIQNQWQMFTENIFKLPEEQSKEYLDLINFLGYDFVKRYRDSNTCDAGWFKKEFTGLYKDYKKNKVGVLEKTPNNLLDFDKKLLLEE